MELMKKDTEFRIIAIDDDPSIHQDFIKILTPPIFQIHTATRSEEGLELVQDAVEKGKSYAMAFVDIRSPSEMDGIETIKKIWQLDPDIQTVICTSSLDESWFQTLEKLGAEDNLLILKKPFDHFAVRQLACALSKKWELLRDRRHDIEFQATHDSATELPNRVLLTDRIRSSISRMHFSNQLLGIFFFNLDHFKWINDSLGHEVGDELLIQVTKRLQRSLRIDDTIARLVGDEFVVLVSDFNDHGAAEKLAQKFITIFEKPFHVANREVVVTASIGISLYPQDGSTVEELLKASDLAMSRAKELGPNKFQFYTKKLIKKSLERLENEAELRRAIKNKEFFLSFQPQVDSNTGKIISVEALIRWQHPQKGIIPPMDFIPLTEETGLIVSIGEWVLRMACEQNKIWQNLNLPPIRIAVNVASAQLKQPNFAELVSKILQETELEAKYLEIEMTENIVIADSDIINVINELDKLGVKIVLDDFGIGNSSLNYLKKIHIDSLKIDQSFVQNIHLNKSDEVIIHAIVAMAKSLNFSVVAEGVESEEQLTFLRGQRCHEIQGFYYSEPVSADNITEMLKRG